MRSIGIFDRGQAVGFELNNNRIISIIIAFAFLITFCFVKIPGLEPEANRLLGLALCVIILWITDAIPITATSFILLFCMPFLNIRDLNTVLTDFGTSPFLWVMCLIVIASAMSQTNLARRIAYWYILKLGTSASKLLLAIVITSATLSIFVADTPVIAMLYPVALEILNRLGISSDSTEEEGRNLGKAMMIGVPIGSLIGGCGLISGSGINIMGVVVLEKFTGMSIGYLEWASYGIPFVLITIVPAWYVLNKTFKIDKIKLNIDRPFIEEKVKELGAFSIGEKRVLLIYMIMFALFFTSDFTNIPLVLACFLPFILVISPCIGVVDWAKAQTKVPWDAIIIIGATTGFAYAIRDTGLGPFFIQEALGGWIGNVHPYLIIFMIAAVGVLSHALIVGQSGAAVAVTLGCVAALVETTGLNPAILLLPAIFTGAAATIIPIQIEFFITKPAGFWEFKDVPLPGAIIGLIWAVVITLVIIVIGTIRGLL